MKIVAKYTLTAIIAMGFFIGVLNAKVVTIASGASGSLAFNTGQAVAKLAHRKAKIAARTQPITGFIPLINNGEIDFGFANSVESEFALLGTGNYKGKPNPNLRLVGMMFPLKTGLAVVGNSGIKTIQDLKKNSKNLRIASKYTASTTIPYYISAALANGGMKYNDFKKVPVSSFVKGMQALDEGLVDVTLISLNSGAAKKANAKLRSKGGIKYVSLDKSKEAVKAFKSIMPSASIVTFKANKNIPGLQEDANIIQIPWLMLVNKDVPDELVYKITKIIAQNKEFLKKSFGAFRYADIEKMATKSKIQYHPGALKYYKEANIGVGK